MSPRMAWADRSFHRKPHEDGTGSHSRLSRTVNIFRKASSVTKEETKKDRLADFTRDIRILVVALMALPIGVMSAIVAYALVWLIGAITNLAFYQRLAADFISPAQH